MGCVRSGSLALLLSPPPLLAAPTRRPAARGVAVHPRPPHPPPPPPDGWQHCWRHLGTSPPRAPPPPSPFGLATPHPPPHSPVDRQHCWWDLGTTPPPRPLSGPTATAALPRSRRTPPPAPSTRRSPRRPSLSACPCWSRTPLPPSRPSPRGATTVVAVAADARPCGRTLTLDLVEEGGGGSSCEGAQLILPFTLVLPVGGGGFRPPAWPWGLTAHFGRLRHRRLPRPPPPPAGRRHGCRPARRRNKPGGASPGRRRAQRRRVRGEGGRVGLWRLGARRSGSRVVPPAARFEAGTRRRRLDSPRGKRCIRPPAAWVGLCWSSTPPPPPPPAPPSPPPLRPPPLAALAASIELSLRWQQFFLWRRRRRRRRWRRGRLCGVGVTASGGWRHPSRRARPPHLSPTRCCRPGPRAHRAGVSAPSPST